MEFWASYPPYLQEVPLDLSKTVNNSEPPREDEGIGNSFPPFSINMYQSLPSRQPYFPGYLSPPQSNISEISATSESVGSPPPVTPELHETGSLTDDTEYQEFERDALKAMEVKNGGSLVANNPRMRRAVQTNQAADDSYRKQRERNNLAAKQSRDRRKLREVRLALQVRFLKQKLAGLRARLKAGVCKQCLSDRGC